jgi:hypothetical protein
MTGALDCQTIWELFDELRRATNSLISCRESDRNLTWFAGSSNRLGGSWHPRCKFLPIGLDLRQRVALTPSVSRRIVPIRP